MSKKTFIFTIILLACLLPRLSTAATTGKEPALPEPIAALKNEGAQLKYLGRDLGFDGWIAIKNGQEQYFYVTPDGSAFFLGVLFNKNGRAVTFDQMKRFQGQKDPALDDLANAPSQRVEGDSPTTAPTVAPAPALTAPKSGETPMAPSVTSAQPAPSAASVVPAPAPSPAERLFADVQSGSSFTIGKNPSAPILYMFADPLCPHCKDMLRMIRPVLDQGRVQVKILLVGALTPDSAPLAGGIVAQTNPGAALLGLMEGQKVPEKGDPNDPRIVGNLNIMTKWRFGGTPITVYRAKDNRVKILQGPPKSVDVLLQDLR